VLNSGSGFSPRMTFDMQQERIISRVTVDGERSSMHTYIDLKHAISIGFDGERIWTSDHRGRETSLEANLRAEYVSTISILSGSYLLNVPVPREDIVDRIIDSRCVRIKPKCGLPIDLWIDVRSGLLVTAMMLDDRRTEVAPVNRTGR